jgi:hypothetical protein
LDGGVVVTVAVAGAIVEAGGVVAAVAVGAIVTAGAVVAGGGVVVWARTGPTHIVLRRRVVEKILFI